MSLYENCGTLGFSAVSNNSDVLNVTTTIMTLLNELKTKGLIEEDLIRAKKVIETQKLIELDNMGAHLKFLGKCALNGQLFSLEQDIRKLKKTKLDDVNQTMIEIFRNDNLGLAAIGNFEIDEIIPVLRVD